MKKIIILGAGEVGASVAEKLASEANDITVIDRDAARLKELSARLDLRTVVGNAAHPSVLKEAGIQDCELLIAVTEVDEVNMIACKIAASLFSVPKRIARIRSVEYLADERLSGEALFAINHVICPEQIVADYVERLVSFPEALQVLEFAGGRVCLVAVRARADGLMVGLPIADLHDHLKEVDARIVCIFREGRAITPEGSTVIGTGDEVFFLSEASVMRRVMQELRKMDHAVEQVMIAGGSDTALRLAKDLQIDHHVKMLVLDPVQAQDTAAALERTQVLLGSENDSALLKSQNIDKVDLFVAATGNDERNIIASLLAKRLGARRVISLIHQSAFVDLLEDSGINIVIGVADATIGSILSHVRMADVTVVHSLRRGAAEALEIVVHGDRSSSACIGRRVDQIAWPDGSFLGAIARGTEVLMAHHSHSIQEGDHLIIFVSNKKVIRRVERLLQVSGLFI